MSRLFAIVGTDGPSGAELRRQHRAAHLASLEELDKAGKIVHAGPLLDADGAPVGSLIVFEAADLAEAQRRAAADPYVLEGVFATHAVFETRAVLGDRAREAQS